MELEKNIPLYKTFSLKWEHSLNKIKSYFSDNIIQSMCTKKSNQINNEGIETRV